MALTRCDTAGGVTCRRGGGRLERARGHDGQQSGELFPLTPIHQPKLLNLKNSGCAESHADHSIGFPTPTKTLLPLCSAS